jgi:hypothetical protein
MGTDHNKLGNSEHAIIKRKNNYDIKYRMGLGGEETEEEDN